MRTYPHTLLSPISSPFMIPGTRRHRGSVTATRCVCVCVCVCCKHVSSLRFWFMFVCDVCWQPASLSSPTSPRRAFLCLTGQFVSLPPTPSHPFTPYVCVCVCVCVRARMLCVCVCVRYSYSVAQHLATSPPTPRTMRWCCHNCTRQVTNCR